jgi:ATP-dependent exoDNAse (exonuclease V) beta subunit
MNKIELLDKFKVFDDTEFVFNEKYHSYKYKKSSFISVTKTLEHFHTPFDSDKWSKIKAEEQGITQEEILAKWKESNNYANMVGHALHSYAENYFNKIYQPLPTNLDVINRINKFNIIFANKLHMLEPFLFEKKIFSKKWKIAGTMDALFIHNDKLYIVDYKTNKEFLTDNDYKGNHEKLLAPFESLYKNHLNEYSIQQSLYKSILRQNDIEVSDMILIYIGPGEKEPKMYKCKDLCHLIEPWFDKNYQIFHKKI